MTTMDPGLADYALRIPKAELHVHIDGTLEPELKLEIAERNGIDLAEKTADEIRATYVFHDLTTFLAVHYPNMTVLHTERDYFDLCSAYLHRAHSQGVRHVEIFFDPQLHTSRGVSFETMITGYRRAIVEARTSLGIDAQLIMCILRDRDVDDAIATFEEALPFLDWIVGLGLDSDEAGNPPIKFAGLFARARALGLKLTMHCDIDQADTYENIRQVIEEIGVDRIDHGTNIVERPELLALARKRGISFTVCPLSNRSVVPDMKAFEILTLFREGFGVSISSDDPPYFHGYVGDNYVALATATGASATDIAEWARSSFRASWLDPGVLAGFLAEVDGFAMSQNLAIAPTAD